MVLESVVVLDLLTRPIAAYGEHSESIGGIVIVNALGAQVRPDLVDRLIELYCDWRTGCAEVQAAWERFRTASSGDRRIAFAAYLAALDREESACEFYARQVRVVAARCQPRAATAG